MYLKTILQLSGKKVIVRSIDVAETMGFTKPSVSRAMKTLSANGYLEIDHETGAITLLPPGLEVARSLDERQHYLEKIFEYAGVSPETAAEDACKVEHVLSAETFGALKRRFHERYGDEDEDPGEST